MDYASKRYIITGGAGFIGSHTTDFLLSQGAEVVAVDDLSSGKIENLHDAQKSEQFSFEELDLANESEWRKLVEKFRPSAIIHLAALVSVPQSIAQPELNFQKNIVFTHRVIEAARLHGVTKIVFASSSAIYGNTQELPIKENTPAQPISPYGAAKIASEYLLQGAARSFGLSVSANRYFNVFGPRQDPSSPYSGVISLFLDKCKANLPMTILGDGEQTRDFIFVKDVARANALASLATTQTFHAQNIATSQSTTLNQLAQEFLRHFPHCPAPQHKPPRDGDIKHSCGANTAAEKQINFRPVYSFAQGLEELVASVSSHR